MLKDFVGSVWEMTATVKSRKLPESPTLPADVPIKPLKMGGVAGAV